MYLSSMRISNNASVHYINSARIPKFCIVLGGPEYDVAGRLIGKNIFGSGVFFRANTVPPPPPAPCGAGVFAGFIGIYVGIVGGERYIWPFPLLFFMSNILFFSNGRFACIIGW